jgi:hypothetical protein
MVPRLLPDRSGWTLSMTIAMSPPAICLWLGLGDTQSATLDHDAGALARTGKM